MELNESHKKTLDAMATRHGAEHAVLAVSGAINLPYFQRSDLILLSQNPRPIGVAISKELLHRGWVTKVKYSSLYGFEPTHHMLTDAGLRVAEAIIEMQKHDVPPAECTNNELVDWTMLCMDHLRIAV